MARNGDNSAANVATMCPQFKTTSIKGYLDKGFVNAGDKLNGEWTPAQVAQAKSQLEEKGKYVGVEVGRQYPAVLKAYQQIEGILTGLSKSVAKGLKDAGVDQETVDIQLAADEYRMKAIHAAILDRSGQNQVVLRLRKFPELTSSTGAAKESDKTSFSF